MEIVKILGVGLTALIIIIILKQYKPEFTVYVSLVAGIIILVMLIEKIGALVSIFTNICERTTNGGTFLKILLKITGIAILSEFAISICKDSGETAIANKIDLGSKIIIISISIPIITAILELMTSILP